jgi:hypothetical protein
MFMTWKGILAVMLCTAAPMAQEMYDLPYDPADIITLLTRLERLLAKIRRCRHCIC